MRREREKRTPKGSRQQRLEESNRGEGHARDVQGGSLASMGNAASVSPNETDVVVTKKKKPKAKDRKVVSTAEAHPRHPPQVKEQVKGDTPPAQVAAVKRDQEASRGPRPRASGDSKKHAKAPDATPAHQGVNFTLEKAADSRKDAPAAGVRPAIHNRNDEDRVEGKLQQAKGRKYEVEVDQGPKEAPHGHQEELQAQKPSEDARRRGSDEGTASGGNTSESSGESYTSSSYSESEESGDASDDTFFVPEVSCHFSAPSFMSETCLLDLSYACITQ